MPHNPFTTMFTTRGNERVPVGEGNICKQYGITATPMSGAAWKHKSDGIKGNCRYEIKETDNISVSLLLKWLRKIRKEASLAGQSPRLVFRVQNEIWVAMPAREYFSEEEITDKTDTLQADLLPDEQIVVKKQKVIKDEDTSFIEING